jgi:molybdopterin-guanine dinucleotide biosynthesis protein A
MHNAREAPFSSTPFDPFFNVNTPQDLETANALLKDQV